jgi:uncharacterized protein (TIRG00374 family)
MAAITLAANAMNATLPGGTALSVGYTARRLRQRGVSAPTATFALVASGLLSTTTFVLLGLTTAIGSRPSMPTLFGLLGLLLVAVLLASRPQRTIDLLHRIARWALVLLGRLRRRSPTAAAASLDRFTDGLRTVRTRPAHWFAGAGFAALNWLADLACLLASCHAMGLHLAGLVPVTCGYLAGMSAASFSVLPGGIGATDVAIVVALTHAGAASPAATAAVVCYRVISLGLNVTVGWVVYLVTWRARRRESPGVSRIRPTARIPSVSADQIGRIHGGRHALDTHRRTDRRARGPAAPQLRRRRRHALLAAPGGCTHPPGRRPQR